MKRKHKSSEISSMGTDSCFEVYGNSCWPRPWVLISYMWRREAQAKGPFRVKGQIRDAPLNLMPLKGDILRTWKGGDKTRKTNKQTNKKKTCFTKRIIQVILSLNSGFFGRRGRHRPRLGIHCGLKSVRPKI